MRRFIAIGVAAILSGCVAPQPRLADFEARCSGAAFVNYGRCLESTMSAAYPRWRNDSHGDLVETYFSWLNAAGARVASGTMDVNDARMGAATMKARLTEIAVQRDANHQMSRQASQAQMLVGLALIQASRPVPVYASPPVFPTPVLTPQITCSSIVTDKRSGNTITRCW